MTRDSMAKIKILSEGLYFLNFKYWDFTLTFKYTVQDYSVLHKSGKYSVVGNGRHKQKYSFAVCILM